MKIKNLIVGGTIALTGITCVSSFTFTNTEAATTNKWVHTSKGWNFYKNGKKTTGWKYLTKADGEKTPHWSYFGKDGVIRTGWKYLTKADGEKIPHWSYFGPNGWLRTGWQVMSTKTNPDGKQPVHMSYFGSNGWLRTGWVKFGKGTSEPDGNTAVHWSYFGNNGWLRTGWQTMGKGTNNPDGNAAKHISFFGANGWLRTELITFKKGTYNSDGNAPEHKSYFGINGWLRANTAFTLGNIKYKADSRGWLTQVAVFATSVKLNKTSVTVDAGKTTTLTATVSPSNTTNKSITWTSSNTSVATVSGGKIIGKKAGAATITAKTSNGKTATCKVTVKTSSSGSSSGGNTTVYYPDSISLNKTSASVAVGKTVKLTATLKPANVVYNNITWLTSDYTIADVSNTGVVTAKKAGTVTITAITQHPDTNKRKFATCKITVTKDNSNPSIINPTNVTIKTSDGKTRYDWDRSKGMPTTILLKATVEPSTATDKSVTWKSNCPECAKVDSTGKVTIKWDYIPRTIKITATTKNGKVGTFIVTTDDKAVPFY